MLNVSLLKMAFAMEACANVLEATAESEQTCVFLTLKVRCFLDAPQTTLIKTP